MGFHSTKSKFCLRFGHNNHHHGDALPCKVSYREAERQVAPRTPVKSFALHVCVCVVQQAAAGFTHTNILIHNLASCNKLQDRALRIGTRDGYARTHPLFQYELVMGYRNGTNGSEAELAAVTDRNRWSRPEPL